MTESVVRCLEREECESDCDGSVSLLLDIFLLRQITGYTIDKFSF